jgi:glutathione synthase/RimK-type ligase-like ATP-grasp enzyme
MIKLGIVMDPIAQINIKKDTSFAMLLEAQRRGYELTIWKWRSLPDQRRSPRAYRCFPSSKTTTNGTSLASRISNSPRWTWF